MVNPDRRISWERRIMYIKTPVSPLCLSPPSLLTQHLVPVLFLSLPILFPSCSCPLPLVPASALSCFCPCFLFLAFSCIARSCPALPALPGLSYFALSCLVSLRPWLGLYLVMKAFLSCSVLGSAIALPNGLIRNLLPSPCLATCLRPVLYNLDS